MLFSDDCFSHRDFPHFIDKVIGDDVPLDTNVADDVLWVVFDGVLGVKVCVLAQASHIEGDGLLVGVCYLTACALLVAAGVLVYVLILPLDSKVSGSAEIIPVLAPRPVIPVREETGAVVVQQPLSTFVMNQCCPRGDIILVQINQSILHFIGIEHFFGVQTFMPFICFFSL